VPTRRGDVRGGLQVIGNVVAVTVPGFAVGAVFMALANRRISVETARARWLKITVFFVVVHAVLGVAAAGRPWDRLLLLILRPARGLRRAWQLIPTLTGPRLVFQSRRWHWCQLVCRRKSSRFFW
jgi:hypothetical protein